MKVPTTGTSVFSPNVSAGATGTQLTTNFVIDSQWINYIAGASENTAFNDRLRGNSSTTTSSGNILISSSTAAESSVATTRNWDNTGFQVPSYYSGASTIYWNFRRAPSFFDEVCYTGTGASSIAITHNLQAVPELIITKCRSTGGNWWMVYSATLGANKYLSITNNGTEPAATGSVYPTTPTSTTFYVNGTFTDVGGSGLTYVSYLFATCAGVSKVGSYTGTATTKQIDCGFTAGARFILIKRTDSTGDWYVWDTARGIVSGNDPYLLLNSTAAEVTNTDYIDTYSAGFEISSTAPAAINASGGTFIFLAIA
jgi:hypothetical protein